MAEGNLPKHRYATGPQQDQKQTMRETTRKEMTSYFTRENLRITIYSILFMVTRSLLHFVGNNIILNVSDDELLSGAVSCYRPATEAELAQLSGNWKYGTYLSSIVIRGRYYLPWLLHNLQRNGCKVIQKTISSFAELEGAYNVVVNCTGLRSATLCNDDRVVPIRGQILKVRAPNINRFYLCGDTYIIPHGYGIVSLGGTAQYNVSDTKLRRDDSESIRSRCARVFPELKAAAVVWEWVGIRPFRDVVRVEAETKRKLKLVHNYGHGGSGITSAPATARDAVKLVQQQLLSSNL